MRVYLKQAAMMKMMPGARFGNAAAIGGDVFFIPIIISTWKEVTLKECWQDYLFIFLLSCQFWIDKYLKWYIYT